jgi:diguanylate cyclase (GGDEF)-like protein
MNIGLLVTLIEDSEVKRICIGADKAAKDKGITLVIIPGRYIQNDDNSGERPFEYQYSALFDYAASTDFDALIVDIKRIGSRTTILKKEAFLGKFKDIPVLTLSEQMGYNQVNEPEKSEYSFEQLGYEAVCDAVFYAKNQVLPPRQEVQTFSFTQPSGSYALSSLADMSYRLLHEKYDFVRDYNIFTDIVARHGARCSGVMLFDKKVSNSVKFPWEKPENICIKSAVIGAQKMNFEDGNMMLSTDKIISTFSQGKSGSYIIGNLFVGQFQTGLMICELVPPLLVDYYFDNLLSVVTGVSRISILEKSLKSTTEELYEVQEELARDGSVLDHIGDKDFLTGGLNRRGFFAKAYDLLKEQFKEGRYAVVAYIYMESLKRINDMFGHDEGDKAVKRVSQILEEVFSGCIYGRIRGNEFAVIVISDEEGRAESLREEMSTQNAKLLKESNRYINHLQYSICEFSHDENLSLREMLRETDEALQVLKGNM